MKKRKFKKANEISDELKKLKHMRERLDCGDFEVGVFVVEPDADCDDMPPDSEILRKEIDQTKMMACAVISDSINKRIESLNVEFKKL